MLVVCWNAVYDTLNTWRFFRVKGQVVHMSNLPSTTDPGQIKVTSESQHIRSPLNRRLV